MKTWLSAAGLAICLALAPASAAACAIDNSASLSANGYRAVKDVDAIAAAKPNAWVPFLFQRVYGRGQVIRFAEDQADLRKTLDRQTLRHPFLWNWGDGRESAGATDSHVYRNDGTYVLTVYDFSDGVWQPFDKAKIRIVPPGEVWRDNLGQNVLDVFSVAVTWLVRAAEAVVAGVIGFLIWRDVRARRRQRRHQSAA